MAKVFIGMTAYNGERFIKEAIDSLLNQSFSNFTLFISDDASTDKTSEICLDYAKKDRRIVYHRQDKNIGMFPNFKFTIDKADAPYFMWAAQDDLWEKDYIKTCIYNIEQRGADVVNCVIAGIDSYGRSARELTDMVVLSGHPGTRQIVRYVMQPEILGKCNLMYSFFKTDVMKKVWEMYPMKMEWGTDYHFGLAIVSHFKVYIDNNILFKKRYGGFTSPDAIKDDRPEQVQRITIKNPKNHIFPFGRFKQYFRGHMKALRRTPYRPLVAALLFLRLPRSFFIHLKGRNIKMFTKRSISEK